MLDGAMGGGEDFDPTTSSRRFPIFVSDICALDLVPQITNTVRRCAPGVHLDLQNLACDQVGPALATGRIEFAIGHFPGSTDSNRIRLFDDHYVLLLGRKHPLASQPVRRDGLARLCFVRVGSDFKVEDPLHQFALESNIRLTIPDATMLRIALAGSDLAAMLPSRMARRLAAGTSFRLIEINPQLSSFPISIRWKRPAEADSGSRWLHAVVRQLSLSNEDATVRRRRPMQPTHDY